MDFQGKVLQKSQLVGKIYELQIRLDQPSSIDFIAGQFVTFKVDGKLRAYSIASAPAITSAPKTDNSVLDFCIDISPNGLGSQFVENLQVGDRVEFQGPFGFFHLKKLTERKNILLIGTGVGVAPFKAIIDDALQNNFDRQITLLFGVRNEQALFYADHFTKLAEAHQNFKFIPTLSQPSESWTGSSGRVTKYLEENFDQYKNCQVFICGSPEMIKDARALLLQKGLPISQIKLEVFN